MDYMSESSVATDNKGRLTFNNLLYLFILGILWVERGCIVVFIRSTRLECAPNFLLLLQTGRQN